MGFSLFQGCLACLHPAPRLSAASCGDAESQRGGGEPGQRHQDGPTMDPGALPLARLLNRGACRWCQLCFICDRDSRKNQQRGAAHRTQNGVGGGCSLLQSRQVAHMAYCRAVCVYGALCCTYDSSRGRGGNAHTSSALLESCGCREKWWQPSSLLTRVRVCVTFKLLSPRYQHAQHTSRCSAEPPSFSLDGHARTP